MGEEEQQDEEEEEEEAQDRQRETRGVGPPRPAKGSSVTQFSSAIIINGHGG